MSTINTNSKTKKTDTAKKTAKKKAKRVTVTKKITDAKILEAIKDSGGIISNIGEKLGVSWHTAKALIERNETTKQAYDAENERMLDVGESVLMNLVSEGDPLMLKFYLSTKGRNRGYGANLDVTTKGKELPEGKESVVKFAVIELPAHLKAEKKES